MANEEASEEVSNGCSALLKRAPYCAETFYGETCVEVKETVFIWTIKNASQCYVPNGEYCKSPSYSFDINQNLSEWQFLYYPNGCDTSNESWASLKLYERIYSGSYVQLYIKISMIDGSKIERVQYQNFISLDLENSKVLSLEKFICSKDIANFVVNGNLKIICRLYNDVRFDRFEPTRYNLCESIENNMISLINDFEKLLDNSQFSDVKLKTNDQEFSVHKAILSARSRVFQAMFEHDMKENTENVVSIIDIDGEIMKEILRFIYTGKVDNLETIADKLLIAADKYELNGLKIICETAITKTLCGTTIKDTLILVDHYDAKRLRDSAIEFIAMHAKDLSLDDNFNAAIRNLSPSLLALVIKALMSRA